MTNVTERLNQGCFVTKWFWGTGQPLQESGMIYRQVVEL